jgi:EAL and modified HD-GYP domain-containing signal transduction protein
MGRPLHGRRRGGGASMTDIYIGRQPIYDRKLEVVAYELLYRDSEENRANITDFDAASSEMIFNALVEFGLDRLVGPHRAFMNMTHNLLVSGKPLALPPGKVVLEVLETTEVDDAVVAAVEELSRAGFSIALDDFFYQESWRPLVQRAHVIKVDVLGLTEDEIREQVTLLKGCKATLLAEKVETQACYDFCRGLGFEYFQGHFFCRPNVIKGNRMPANRIPVIRLLAALNNPNATMEELEALITQDVALSYRLLRYINSAFFSLANEIESIRHALVLLGHRSVRRWATLISMASASDKPHELMVTAMVRAKMCELLARDLDAENTETFFTVGLFSVLDALMDAPLAETLAALPLTREVSDALLERKGVLGRALDCTLAYEDADWDRVNALELAPGAIQAAYLDAVTWVNDAEAAMSGEG